MDAFERKLRAQDTIRKLLGLASGNSNQHEAAAAMAKAQNLAREHGIDIQGILPTKPVTMADKLAAARKMSAGFGATFKKQFPGQDSEDYTKYDEKGRLKDRPKPEPGSDTFSWGDEEGY